MQLFQAVSWYGRGILARPKVIFYDLDSPQTLAGAAGIVSRGFIPVNVLHAMFSRARLQQSEG